MGCRLSPRPPCYPPHTTPQPEQGVLGPLGGQSSDLTPTPPDTLVHPSGLNHLMLSPAGGDLCVSLASVALLLVPFTKTDLGCLSAQPDSQMLAL